MTCSSGSFEPVLALFGRHPMGYWPLPSGCLVRMRLRPSTIGEPMPPESLPITACTEEG